MAELRAGGRLRPDAQQETGARRNSGARHGSGWPIRAYLIGLVALLVLAAVAAAGYGWVQADRDARRAAEQDASFAARLAATELATGIASVRASVEQLATSPAIAQAYTQPGSCELSLALPGGSDAGHLDLVRTDGSVVCSSRKGKSGTSYAGADWLAAARRAPVFRVPTPDPMVGVPALLTTMPVPGYGLISGFINLHLLGPALADAYGGPHRLEFLVVGGDTVLTRSVDPARWVGVKPEKTSFGTGGAAGERRDVTGVRRLYGRADVPGLGWRVYAGANRSSALAAARSLAERQLLIVSVGLLVALAAAFVVYRRITRPIGRLSAAVRAVAAAPGDGPTIEVAGPAEVTGLAGDVNSLVTEVRSELAERRRAEEAYRSLFDGSPYPMWVFDSESLAILEVNDAAVAHYGYSRAEFLALTVPDLGAADFSAADFSAADFSAADFSAADFSAADFSAAGSGEPDDDGSPLRHRRSDGSTIEVRVTTHALVFDGHPARCAVIEDVTQKEQLERRLQQSERLESLGQLAGGVAHDFNNLLGIIAGYTTFAADEVTAAAQDDERWQQMRDDLAQVLRAVDRASRLTRQLLAFARRDVVRPHVLDLNAVVGEVEQLLLRTLGEDIQLHTHLAGDLRPIKADPGQLEQVLVNLAVNARDAMPTGGTLVIDTGNIAVDEHYAATHPGVDPGGYVRLRVSDTGTGMSRATVERAFEPFFTTKPKGQGTGLGLATIYGIITEAGGQVQIYSEPGVGTTITALLPATADTAVVDGATVVTPAQAGRGETILVVEDEDSLRALTQRILTRNGYQVLTAADGPAALARAADHPGPIDLLLTDVVMPRMLGHELAHQVLETRPGVRVIYMSGYAETVLTVHKTLPPGVTLLSKPVSESALLGTVRQALDSPLAAQSP